VFNWTEFFSEVERNLWNEGEPVWAILTRLEQVLSVWDAPLLRKVTSGVYIEGRVSIGSGSILEPGVFIQGPCVIGRNCRIRHGAFLRGGVLCGDHSVIGHSSEVKHSILLEGAHVAHLNYVGDSILGRGVNLGAGVKCSNVRFDRRSIRVGAVSTGLRKMGCIIGDGSQIGCNSVINPGTLIGPHCFSYPLLNLHGIIPPRTRVRGKGDELQLAPLEVEILESLR
jgi:UDP-N-acetylglucosamine diphosphorylase / glucose-1-phosphate thymidylyltransferase / UDP-N-acetylgalactosamine diphosphorylase / glucosamine-1-phosphate N-acetyltransferase / galactosamine-1-phosphate N-acetyltransferase